MKSRVVFTTLAVLLVSGAADAASNFFHITNRSQMPARPDGVSCDYADHPNGVGSVFLSSSAKPLLQLQYFGYQWANGHVRNLRIKSKELSQFTVEVQWIKGEKGRIPMDPGIENQFSATLSVDTETGSGVITVADYPTPGKSEARPLKNCKALLEGPIDMTGAWITF